MTRYLNTLLTPFPWYPALAARRAAGRIGVAVGLSAQDLSEMHRLAELAMNPQATRRDDIYMAVASLYRSQGDQLSPRERMLMREIPMRLTRDAEMAIRVEPPDGELTSGNAFWHDRSCCGGPFWA